MQEHRTTDLVILEQFDAFKQEILPTITDPRIKSISIIECFESLINIRTESHPRIYMLPDPQKPFDHPDYNSGFLSASMMRETLFNKLVTMLNYLDEFAPEFGYKPGEISIAVFEALRDIPIQENLFNAKRAEIQEAHPDFNDEQLDQETAKWVSPVKNNVPVHSTEAAVDIRLIYKNEFVNTGKFGVIWGTNPSAPTFSEDLTDAQKLNRLYMLLAATKAGLVNYPYEFWHYSYGDRYAAYWHEIPTAQYGSIR